MMCACIMGCEVFSKDAAAETKEICSSADDAAIALKINAWSTSLARGAGYYKDTISAPDTLCDGAKCVSYCASRAFCASAPKTKCEALK